MVVPSLLRRHEHLAPELSERPCRPLEDVKMMPPLLTTSRVLPSRDHQIALMDAALRRDERALARVRVRARELVVARVSLERVAFPRFTLRAIEAKGGRASATAPTLRRPREKSGRGRRVKKARDSFAPHVGDGSDRTCASAHAGVDVMWSLFTR